MKSTALRMIAAAAVFVLCTITPLRAADEDLGGSFLNPFPEGDVYRVAVVGDSFGEGLLAGLLETFGADTRLNFEKKTRSLEGVMSSGFEDKAKALEELFQKDPVNIVVVMVGEDDRVALKSSSNRRVAIMSDEWRAEYGRRLDRIIRAVKQKNTGVYWVGLPNLARGDANQQALGMNEIIRERAYQNGLRFIDIVAGFQDENGAYSAYGPDMTGKVRVLREPDGVHFTEAGNGKLAHFVEKEMRRDLNQAKSERTVPLLGSEVEQAKINPENAVTAVAPSSPAAPNKPAEPQAQKPVITAPADPSGEQKAENSKVTLKVVGAGGREETLNVEIVRPAIPASVVSLMARRAGTGQMGDLLIDQIGGGMTLMNSVTPSGQKGGGKLSPSQAPYFRLLVKGERLTPKPGRADDLFWGKPDTSSDAARAQGQPRG